MTSEKVTAGRLEDREESEATSRLTYLSHALEASAGLLAPHRLRVRRTAQFFFCAENPSLRRGAVPTRTCCTSPTAAAIGSVASSVKSPKQPNSFRKKEIYH